MVKRMTKRRLKNVRVREAMLSSKFFFVGRNIVLGCC